MSEIIALTKNGMISIISVPSKKNLSVLNLVVDGTVVAKFNCMAVHDLAVETFRESVKLGNTSPGERRRANFIEEENATKPTI